MQEKKQKDLKLEAKNIIFTLKIVISLLKE